MNDEQPTIPPQPYQEQADVVSAPQAAYQAVPSLQPTTSSMAINWSYLFSDSRAKVYLLWAILTFVGFVTTHYYQNANINGVWTILSVIGLGYMCKVMPLKLKAMKSILMIWASVIVIGIATSAIVAHSTNPDIGQYVRYLGAFWLALMGVGYALNGLVDGPSAWYWIAAVLNIGAGLLCYYVAEFTIAQYLIAGIVSGWSMLNLWLFRSSYQ